MSLLDINTIHLSFLAMSDAYARLFTLIQLYPKYRISKFM